jgi:hypothetical protein
MTQEARRASWAQHRSEKMISLTTNARGMSVMNQNVAKSFTEMTGPELVQAYNSMANSTLGQELGIKPVQRFSDTKSALARTEKLASSIKARASGLKKEEASAKTNSPVAQEFLGAVQPKKQEADVAKVTTKKSAAKIKPAADKLDSFPVPKGTASIVAAFAPRVESFREKLLTKLADNIGKQVPLNDLIVSTYGRAADKEEMKGALMMVLKGVTIMIAGGKLPFTLEKEKAENGKISFGLFKK